MQTFFLLLSLLLGASCQSFDFIVVGSGAGGGAVSAKLVGKGYSVLLLEAGGPFNEADPIQNDVRNCFLNPVFNAQQDWNISSVNMTGLGDRSVTFPRARMAGGSTSWNCGIMNRGTEYDYLKWEKDTGCSFRYPKIIRLYKELENYTRNSRYHGSRGPFIVNVEEPQNFTADWVEASVLLGIPNSEDLNGAENLGVGKTPSSYGVASSRLASWKALIAPNVGLPNFEFRTFSTVTKIIFDGDSATGVEFANSSGTYEVSAGMEVILSAGVFGTPQLLQLSGIGDKNLLTNLGISVIHDSPGVGQNLQSHGMVPAVYSFSGPSPDEYNGVGVPIQIMDSISRVFDSGGASADYEIIPASDKLGLRFPIDNNNTLWIGVLAFNSFSRGSVKINSTDVLANPVVDFNSLSDDRDVVVITRGLERVRELVSVAPLAQWIGTELAPGPDVVAYARASYGIVHAGGTAKIGSESDAFSVLDCEFRVRGVSGLRVVDGSAIPSLTSGHAQFPIYLLGSMLGDFLLEEYR